MRRVLAIVAAFLLVLGSVQSLGAEKRTIKWVASIYSDANGVGLKYPEGVACTDEYLIVADTGNSRLLRYSYRGDDRHRWRRSSLCPSPTRSGFT